MSPEQARFFSNPNNAFVVQGVFALVFGALHISSYDTYGSKIAGPIYQAFGKELTAVMAVMPHVK